MSFEVDGKAVWMAAAFVIGLLFFIRRSLCFSPPLIRFSSTKNLLECRTGWKVRLASWIPFLNYTTLLLLLGAFVDPHFFIEKTTAETQQNSAKRKPLPTEGIAIYLVLDRSGSMQEHVRGMSERGYMALVPKMELEKTVTKDFIQGNSETDLEGRQNDLMGLVGFARTAEVLSPLTLDHRAVLDQINKLNIVSESDDDGTAIGYAIFKTANLIAATRHFAKDLKGEGKPAYEIKSSAIILVTDGFQDPNRLDAGNDLRNISPMEAAKFAKNEHIHLYVINVDPKMAEEQFGPQRRLMERVAEYTGGKFFLAGSSKSLSQIYSEIDKMEKSPLPETAEISKSQQPDIYKRVSLYPWLIAFAMLLIFFSKCLESLLVRRFP